MENPYNIWCKNAIPNMTHIPKGDHKWLYTDNAENFSPQGYWKEDDISYSINSHGFRTNEFSNLKTEDYNIMFMGCSHMFGLGLRLEDTLPYIFTRLTKDSFYPSVTGINMGVPAASMTLCVRILHQTINIIKPDMVICLAPAMSRNERYYSKNNIMEYEVILPSFFLETKKREKLGKSFFHYHTNETILFQYIQNIIMMEYITSLHGVKLFWMSVDDDINKMNLNAFVSAENKMDISFYSDKANNPRDNEIKARDGMHCGPIFNKSLAEEMVEKILISAKKDH